MSIQSLSGRIGLPRLEAMIDIYARKGDATPHEAELTVLLAEHLTELREAGVLQPHNALPNRSMHVIESWNGMWKGTAYTKPADEARDTAERFGWHLINAGLVDLAYLQAKGMSESERAQAFYDLTMRMDAGDVSYWRIGNLEEDYASGERLAYEMRAWNLVVGRRPERGVRHLEPVEDVGPKTLHHVDIEVPTGELLVADWFRADGFTDLVDEGNPWRGVSCAENEADAERYVRDHGFVSVKSAMRSLTILRNRDRIAIGSHDEEVAHALPVGYRRVKDMLIDLRKVSIVDRSKLVETLSRMHPHDRAERLAGEVAAADGTVRIKVAPGRYRVTSSGYGGIGDLLEEGHPHKRNGYEPVLLLERI